MKISVMVDNQTYEVKIEDIQARPVIAVIEGQRFEVWPDPDATSETTVQATPIVSVPEPSQTTRPFGAASQDTSNNAVTSPLPGVIEAILVETGDTVSHGDELCILEAMKMKNAIRSNRDGVIASVEVQVGDQVSHGQLLLTFQK